jgi:Xaa-Pro aminopeptidase
MSTATAVLPEREREARLLAAQDSAAALFAEIERSLIRPGIAESALNREIHALAAEMFGVKSHWHQRVVRAGVNTLVPYGPAPPELTIQEDDILFVDLGPVFEAWEADFGRTYVLGDDPAKHRLVADLAAIFGRGKAHFAATPDITGEAMYAHMTGLAEAAGWEFGGKIAGHLIGAFPHRRAPGANVLSNIAPGNDQRMNRLDPAGQKYHWILEVHLVDRARGIGGFYEELLTVG